MRIERDAAGCVHIEDEGVTAIVDESDNCSYAMTPTATRCAVQRVCALVADPSRWPTLRLRRFDVVHGDVVPIT